MSTTPPPAFDLATLFGPEQIIPAMTAANRWQAIDELIANLIHTGRIKPEHSDGVTAAVRKREMSMSTGIGLGIGMPHASSDLVTELTGALGRAPAGIPFESLDGKPVSLCLLLLVPQGQFQKHLHTVAGIAKLFRNEDFRQALLLAPDAAAMHQIIRTQTAR